jgi:hypothetical protein
MNQYPNIKRIRISDLQKERLLIIKRNRISVARFIRQAIDEKIDREFDKITAPDKFPDLPF